MIPRKKTDSPTACIELHEPRYLQLSGLFSSVQCLSCIPLRSLRLPQRPLFARPLALRKLLLAHDALIYCWILVTLRLKMRVKLDSWVEFMVLPVVFHERQCLGDMSPNEEILFEWSYPSYAETLSNEWGGARANATQTASLFETSMVASENTADLPAASAIEVSGKGSSQRTGPNEARGVSLSSSILRSLGTSLALLLLLGFLTAGLKRDFASKAKARLQTEAELPPGEAPKEAELTKQASPTGEVESSTEDKRAKTRGRLEAVRALLPAAERLVAALRSAEAQNLLRKVQESVRALETQETEVKSSKGLEGPLEDALAAFRELHQAAVERVEAMAQNAAFLSPFPLLGPWGEEPEAEAVSDVQHGLADQETVRAFVISLRSFYQSAKSLSQRFLDVQRRLSTEHFADERDGQLLIAAAKDLEYLRTTDIIRIRTIEVAEKLKEGTVHAIRTLLLWEREFGLLHIRSDVESMQLYADLARESANTSPAPRVASALNALHAELKLTTALLDRLQSDVQTMRTSNTVGLIVEADMRARQLQRWATASLERCLDLQRGIATLPQDLNDASRQKLAELARRLNQRATSLNSIVKGASNEAEEVAGDLLPSPTDPSKSGPQHVNGNIAISLLQSLKAIGHMAESRVQDIESVEQALQEVNLLRPGMEQVQTAAASVTSLATDKKTALFMLLSCRLTAFLERDAELISHVVNQVALPCFNQSHPESVELKELQRRLNADKAALKAATTLTEAARAAASMRAHANTFVELAHTELRDSVRPE